MEVTLFDYTPDKDDHTFIFLYSSENTSGDVSGPSALAHQTLFISTFVDNYFSDKGTIAAQGEGMSVQPVGLYEGQSWQRQVVRPQDPPLQLQLCVWVTPVRDYSLLLVASEEHWPKALADVQTALASFETSACVLAENQKIALFDSGRNRLMIDPLPAGWSIECGNDMTLYNDAAAVNDGAKIYGRFSMDTEKIRWLGHANERAFEMAFKEHIADYQDAAWKVRPLSSAPTSCTVGSAQYEGLWQSFEATDADGNKDLFTLWRFSPPGYLVEATLVTAPNSHKRVLRDFQHILDSVTLVPSQTD